MRGTGTIFGLLSTAVSLDSFIDNPNWSDGLDVGFGIAGAIYWPIGVAYTAGRAFVHLTDTNTQAMIDNGIQPGSNIHITDK